MNQDGNQSLNMLLNKEVDCLHDDGFDGSVDEHCIFKEVFFGKDSGKSNKKCLVTGVINFESDHCKKTNVSVHSNSDSSALTSQEAFTVKRMKLSVDKLSNTKPKSKGDISHSIYHPVTCRLVESSSHGVTSSCYLLKRHVGDRNEPKEAISSKAIASPVSQESYASKQLVAFPLFNDADKPRSLRLSKPRWKDSCFMELDIAEMKIPRDSTTDPRSLLRYHIHCLLRGAGWVIGKRKRPKYSNVSGEYVYRSPEGRPIREFRRAWILCGQSLFAYDTDIVIEDIDCKQWTDLAQFCTDMSNTLAEIKEQFDNSETTASLAHWWYLLDPFANVVFIDKTMGLLKEGKRVKAKRSLVIDSFAERDVVLALKDVDSTVFEEDYGTREEHCGSDITCDQTCTDLFEVPITFETQNIFSETGSLNLDNEGPENDAQNENSHFTNDSFTESHNSERTYMQLNTCESASQLFETPIYVVDDASFDAMLRGNSYKKSKNMYEFELTTLYQSKNIDKSPISVKYEPLVTSNIPGKQDGGQKNSMTWHLKDDDLLISAIIKNKKFKSPTKMSSGERVSRKSRKRRTQKGSSRLLPRSGGKLCLEGNWSFSGTRTVLSWLINSGFISLNEVIEYRNTKDDLVVKDGLITWDGILCRCCDKVLSVSEFKIHAGFRSNRPCLNIFLESGKPITLCQLEAWSAEYKARKSATRTVQVEDLDQNDDSCGLCGDGGELICCDNCPSTFHQTCMYVQELPEGSWYCPHCTCRICGNLVIDEDSSQSPGALKCLQCEHKYHAACLLVLERERGLQSGVASDSWFCTDSCQEVYLGLQSRIGIMNSTTDGFCWMLLRCIHGDQKVHSAQRFVALKAECNLKLAVALTIMEECFLPMVDPRTGIDMIPHVLYNWGSKFARLNYHGFQTVVLEKDDVLMSVASIRIHGVEVAEMPLIATCSKYRRQGMCRRLMKAIEEMLKSFKVEKLVISAIPSLVETWTNGFGFEPLEDNDKKSLSTINLMVFPGTIWLKKRLINHHIANQQTDHPTETGSCFEGCPTTASDGNTRVRVDNEYEVNAGGIPEEKFTKTPFKELASATLEGSQGDIICHLESVQVYDDRKTPQMEKIREEGGSKIEVGYNLESVQVYDDIKLPLSQHSQESDVLQGK